MVLIGLLAAALLQTDGGAAFARYPTPLVHAARHATLRLTDARSRRYRTALREAASRRPDFAGGWILATVGCGAGCISPAAVDPASGRVVWFPATVSGWPLEVQQPLHYRRDSRLLVVEGMLDEKEPGATRRYLFDGHRFVPLPG